MALDSSETPQCFPREVLNLFVGHLSRTIHEPGSRAALHSCLLVSRFLCDCARRELFRTVTLRYTKFGIEKMVLRLRLLLDIMNPDPSIGLQGITAHIKKLRIYLGPYTPSHAEFEDFMAKTLEAFRGTSDHGGLKVLSILVLKPRGIDWVSLSAKVQYSISELVPQLETLSISDISNFPLTLFRGSSLKNLHLWNTTFDESPVAILSGSALTEVSKDVPPIPQLESFHKHRANHYPFMQMSTGGAIPMPLLGELRNLQFFVGLPHEYEDIRDILNRSATTIEHLKLHFTDEVPAPLSAFDLERYTNLTCLIIHHIYPNINGVPFTYGIAEIHDLLHTPTPAASLTDIHLSLLIFANYPCESLLSASTAQDAVWRSLDTLLCSPKFPELRKFSFTINLKLGVGQYADNQESVKSNLLALAERLLPSLAANSILSTTVSVVQVLCG
ncbi:hypothetical protein B0H34DRAFT_721613 [Crassisporium funariophilum]|nr:hypothetical protein B0H34DRAFT_721613 [Crassisporium funariophilum]